MASKPPTDGALIAAATLLAACAGTDVDQLDVMNSEDESVAYDVVALARAIDSEAGLPSAEITEINQHS